VLPTEEELAAEEEKAAAEAEAEAEEAAAAEPAAPIEVATVKKGQAVARTDGTVVLGGYGAFDGSSWKNEAGKEIEPPKPLACFLEEITPSGYLTMTFNQTISPMVLNREMIMDGVMKMDIIPFEAEEREVPKEKFAFNWEIVDFEPLSGYITF
jgi:hypothetical protein